MSLDIIPFNNALASTEQIPKDSLLTQEEVKLVEWLLQRSVDERVEVSIPDTISDTDLVRYINSCCKVNNVLDTARQYLHPIIGRLINLVADRPVVMEQFGVDTIEDFFNKVIRQRFNVNRSDAMYARKIVKLFPDITPSEYNSAGAAKLKVIGKGVDWNPNDPNIEMYREYAEQHTRDELIHYMATQGVDVDGMNLTHISIPLTMDESFRWRKFIEDDDIKGYCGTAVPKAIFMRMLDECEAEWTAIKYARRANGIEPAPDERF